MAYTERALDLPQRLVNMPSLFEAQNHPSLAVIPSYAKRSVYIGYMKTDPASMRDYLAFEKKLKCPEGTIKEWKAQGLLEMVPGDVMLLRDAKYSGESLTRDILLKDVLAAMVSGSSHHGPEELANFEAATLRMLGPRDKRTLDSTAFEETKSARKIRKKRCYSVGLAIQQSRRVVAPTASLDQDKANIQEYQEMTKDLVDSTASMLLNVQDLLPEECRDAFKANAELTGQPSVGLLGVHGTSSVQINISAAGLDAGDNRLGNQLGDFGCEHFDRNDSPDHFTTMFSNPDIPAEYEPGAFHILQLGVFVVLRKFVGITFSGRRRHVGTAPTPPLGFSCVPYAYRFNVVWYPKEAAVDGNSRWTLASLPGKGSANDKQKTVTKKAAADKDASVEPATGSIHEAEDLAALSDDEEREQEARKGSEDPEPLYLTPEMINTDDKGAVLRTTNRATFARSGHILMDRQAHMNFMGRSLHQLTSYVWRQLPLEYGIHIDVDKLLEAVTYTHEEDGHRRVSLLPWASAPNVDRVSQERAENKKIWSAYKAKVRPFIPHLAGRPLGTGAGGSVPLAEGAVDPTNRKDTRMRGDTVAATTEMSEDQLRDSNDETLRPSKNNKQGTSKPIGILGGRGGGSVRATQGESVSSKKEKRGGSAVKENEKRKGRKVRIQQVQVQDVKESLQRVRDAGTVIEPSRRSVSWRKVPSQMAQQGDTDPSEGHASTSKRLREDPSVDPDSHTKRPRLVGQESGAGAISQTFPFIQGLGPGVMHQELEEIDRELSLASDISIRSVSAAFHVPHVMAASSALVKEPLSLVAPAHVRDLLTQVRLGVESEITQAVDARLRRYSILVSNVRIWYWLDVTIRSSVRDLFKSSAGLTTGWLGAMVTVARTCLEGKTSLIRFDPQQYPALFVLSSSAIIVPNSCRKLFTSSPKDQEELLKAVTQTIRTALMEALAFPQDAPMKDRRRAWLLGTLVDTIGPCFLATRYAWNTWTSFAVKDYLSLDKMYKDDSDLILPFKRALQLHPICQDQSPDRTFYHRFCRSFCRMTLPALPPHTSKTTPTLVELTSPKLQLDAALLRLVNFLRACLGYIDATLPAKHRVHQLLSQNPDYYLPFREKTPSKIRFNGPEGPFRKPVIQRTTGLFSALVFRGITYNTLYSRHPGSQMQFYGEPHVLLAVDLFKRRYPAEPTEDPHYFCNPNAYSRQPITGRALSQENLKSFWVKAAALDWATRSSETMPFSECLRLLTDANFPTMGTLQIFLLVADLHYAGVCSAPELLDVVDFISRRKPKGGSLKALVSIGLIPSDARITAWQIESGLRTLDSHLRMAFSKEERTRMGYDAICLEHLLCKYQRALNEGVA